MSRYQIFHPGFLFILKALQYKRKSSTEINSFSGGDGPSWTLFDESKKVTKLTIMEKKQLCRYKDENPDVNFTQMAKIFSVTFGRPLSRSTVSRALKFRKNFEQVPEDMITDYDELAARVGIHSNRAKPANARKF